MYTSAIYFSAVLYDAINFYLTYLQIFYPVKKYANKSSICKSWAREIHHHSFGQSDLVCTIRIASATIFSIIPNADVKWIDFCLSPRASTFHSNFQD